MKRTVAPKSLAVIATACIALFSFIFLLQSVKATTWTWTNPETPFTIAEMTEPTPITSDFCIGRYQTIETIVDVDLSFNDTRPLKTGCLIGETAGFRLLAINAQTLAIQFVGDTEAHIITGIDCRYCTYLPSTDTLLAVQSNDYRGFGRIAVYKDFVKHLLIQRDTPTMVTYSIGQEPTRIISDFHTAENYFGYFRAIQHSPNDKWLVAEIVGNGFYRIDLETMQMLKFTNFIEYNSMFEPTAELAITNDGQRIVFVGTNGANRIYEITPDCGAVMPEHPAPTDIIARIPNECPMVNIVSPWVDSRLGEIGRIYSPQFSEDGGELTFLGGAANPNNKSYVYKIRAGNYVPNTQLDYLALGDSYSSGEGDTENKSDGKRYYRQYTNTLGSSSEPRERCHISTRSYPYELANGMHLASNRWNTIACSGATAWDVKQQGSSDYKGQGDRLKDYDVAELKTKALNEFIPGRQKQIEFVKKYQPKVITLTMGGNDIGFGEKIGACASYGQLLLPYTCDWAKTKKSDLAGQILGQFDNLKKLYTELYQASGYSAKIYVLGYPSFINGDEDAKCDLNIASIDKEERALIQNSVRYLNLVISQAAKAAGVKYIDIENSLNGHRLCDDNTVKYVTGVTDGLDWSNYKQESFHPNAKGNFEMAMTVWDKVERASLLDYDICPDSTANICPDISATKESITTPDYFATPSSMPKNIHYKQVAKETQRKQSPIEMKIDSYSFVPGSAVDGTMYSDPVSLGTFIVDSAGGLNATAIIPSTIPAGYHTLVISGESYSGDDIEYEQIILVQGSNPNDIDDDGILDTQDKCLFYTPSNTDIDKDGKDDACDPTIGEPTVIVPSPSPSPTSSPTPSPKPQPTTNFLHNVILIVVAIVKTIVNILRNIWLFFGR